MLFTRQIRSLVIRIVVLVVIIIITSCNSVAFEQHSDDVVSLDVDGQALLATPTQSPTPTETLITTAEIATNADFPDPKEYVWKLISSGFERPVDLDSPADGSGRLFVLEQGGRIHIIENGWVQIEPFLDLSQQVSTEIGLERGLLGLAFHPQFEINGVFFIYYTDLSGNSILSSFSVSTADPNFADASSEQVILEIQQPGIEHNGGALVFGPDGYLYLGVGDGDFYKEPQIDNPAQDTHSLLGKILRIDINSEADLYTIPPENPFAQGGGSPEVWAYGLRNPWRVTFNMQTSEVFIADVGQFYWEEINYLPEIVDRPMNYGWSYFEGWLSYQEEEVNIGPLRFPIIEYSHEDGGCAVIGGEVYLGETMPEWNGVYFFGDFCLGAIWGAQKNPDDSWSTQALYSIGSNITSFGLDEQGEIYVLDIDGRVQQLVPFTDP